MMNAMAMRVKWSPREADLKTTDKTRIRTLSMHEIAAYQVNRSLEGNKSEAIVAPSDYTSRRLRNARDHDGRPDLAEFLKVESLNLSNVARRFADKERFVQ